MYDYDDFLCDDYYDFFDELRRRKIDPKQLELDFGRGTAFRMNTICPIIVKKGGVGFDEIAMDYGFDGTGALYEHIMNYKPKYKVVREVRNYYMEMEEYFDNGYR